MKIKNLVINTAAVVLSGVVAFSATTQTAKAYTTQPNYGIYSGIDANYYSGPVYYFTEIMNSNVKNILGKTASSTNLKEVLKNYRELYNFCYKNTLIRNQYYQNLTQNEQIALSYLVRDWEERIADVYRDKYYFASTCNSLLGYKLTYVNDNYYETHREIMDKIEEKEETFNKYMNTSATSSNLKTILEPYKYLLNYIKGTKVNGYYFTDLNPNERQELLRLVEIWTINIESKFGGLSNYNTTCRSKVNFIVNLNNLYNELKDVLEVLGNNNVNLPGVNTQNPTLPTNPTTPGTVPPAVPTTPSTQVQTPSVQVPSAETPAPAVPTTPTVQVPPAVPSVPTVETQQPKINNTIGKDWSVHFSNPYPNTSRGVSDFTPENVEDIYNPKDEWRYTQDGRGYYYQNGYIDQYGNFIPYNNYNNGYNNGYQADYTPRKVLK